MNEEIKKKLQEGILNCAAKTSDANLTASEALNYAQATALLASSIIKLEEYEESKI